MVYTREYLIEASGYKLSYLTKLLGDCYISNHFELSKDDLMKLYNKLNVVSNKSQRLKNTLREILKDELSFQSVKVES